MSKFNDLITSHKIVLVDFFAEWCGPCKTMAPILSSVKSQLGNQVKILKIDVDKNQNLSSQFAIKSVPTLKLYINGKEKWTGNGVVQASQIIDLISYYNQ